MHTASQPMRSAASRTALITGASRGLGLALARALAAQGWRLILDARGAAALEAARAELAQHTTVHALAGDVTDDAHRQVLATAARECGGLDAIINNASILGPSPQPSLLDYPLDVLRAVFEANTLAPLALLQTLVPTLAPGGVALNITSDAAVEAYPGWGGYGASKAALEQLTHVFAAERPDLRVYWVDPGDMRTEMHQQAFPGEDISDRPLPDVSVPGLLALLTGAHPSGRYAARAIAPPADEAAAEPASKSATPAPPAVREVRVALTVADFERMVTLYRDGFGMAVVKEWTLPEGRGIILEGGRGTLELLDHADAEYTDRIEAGGRRSGPVRLAFAVANVAASAAALQRHGAEIVHPLVATTWGGHNQRLQAPDGMQISLFAGDSAVRISSTEDSAE